MIDRQSILDVLRTIPDPEMPISIVDLGLIESVEVAAAGDSSVVRIVALPTFVGCPALEMIRRDIEHRLGAMPGIGAVEVQWVHDPPWSVDRISAAGRESLRVHGVTVPDRGGPPAAFGSANVGLTIGGAVPCPFCGSMRTRQESPFGPTRCRMIYYCDACRNSFEHLKRV